MTVYSMFFEFTMIKTSTKYIYVFGTGLFMLKNKLHRNV